MVGWLARCCRNLYFQVLLFPIDKNNSEKENRVEERREQKKEMVRAVIFLDLFELYAVGTSSTVDVFLGSGKQTI